MSFCITDRSLSQLRRRNIDSVKYQHQPMIGRARRDSFVRTLVPCQENFLSSSVTIKRKRKLFQSKQRTPVEPSCSEKTQPIDFISVISQPDGIFFSQFLQIFRLNKNNDLRVRPKSSMNKRFEFRFGRDRTTCQLTTTGRKMSCLTNER